MRLLICAGGTGGGVYPALSVLLHLRKTSDRAALPEILWLGSEGGMEADLVQREGVRFVAIPSAGVHGVGLRALPGNLLRLVRGFQAAWRSLRSFRPQVLLFTGGFVAVPVAVASWIMGQGKRLVYVPDIEPGWALKVLARLADAIALTVDDSQAFFKGKRALYITGYPLRAGLESWTRAQALATFGLRDDLPVLLVTGGSKGARSINTALSVGLAQLLPTMQVLHISGKLDWAALEQARQALPEELAKNYRLFPYLHEEMGAALRAADLAVMRAGASTLGELPLFGLPAILVPYPHAWRYQRVNAAYLAERGAAQVLADEQLADQLVPQVRALMADAPRRQQMRAASLALARPQAAAQIGALLAQLAGPGGVLNG